MIDTLYVNGCSWTSGTELEEDPAFVKYLNEHKWRRQDPTDPINWNIIDEQDNIVSRFEYYYDEFNWAGILKKKLDIPALVNHSIGAASNHRILRTTLDYIRKFPKENYKNLFVIIGWTSCDRDEIYVNNMWQRFNPTQKFSSTYDDPNPINKQSLDELDKFQDIYTASVHNDYTGIYEYLQMNMLLANMLENLGIRYFFFNALPPWWEGGHLKSNCDVNKEFTLEIEEHNSHNNFLRTYDNMYYFINNNKFPLAKYLHPLREGHAAWANYLHNQLVERKIV